MKKKIMLKLKKILTNRKGQLERFLLRVRAPLVTQLDVPYIAQSLCNCDKGPINQEAREASGRRGRSHCATAALFRCSM